MARLTAAKRNALPSKDFAGPGRSFPVQDKAHAIAAKGRATQAVKAGRMTKSTEAKIDQAADDKLYSGGESPGDKHWSGR